MILKLSKEGQAKIQELEKYAKSLGFTVDDCRTGFNSEDITSLTGGLKGIINIEVKLNLIMDSTFVEIEK